MSPASYLTAPPRVAAPIVAPRSFRGDVQNEWNGASESQKCAGSTPCPRRADYHAGVSTAGWIALAFLVVAVVASLAYVGVRGLRLWRSFRSFANATETALDHVTRATARAEEGSAALSANQERLAKAMEHLQISLAQLTVLRAAAAEVNAKLQVLRSLVPSK